MKHKLATSILLLHTGLAAATTQVRQALPYEYDFLDTIYDVYGHDSTAYTVSVSRQQPFFILEPGERNWTLGEITCKETTSYYLWAHKYYKDPAYGNIFSNTQSGLIDVSFCGQDNQRLNGFLDLIEKNGRKYVSQLVEGLGPEQTRQYGVSFIKTSEPGGQAITYFPFVGGGHGGGIAYTATTVIPSKKKRLVIQVLSNEICAFHKEAGICNDQQNKLIELTRNIVKRYTKY